MNTYHNKNRACFAGALISILISNTVAVALQFVKGEVLDFAILGDIRATANYASLLISLILFEIMLHFCYNRLSAMYVVGCAKNLRHDLFESVMRRSYVDYRRLTQRLRKPP